MGSIKAMYEEFSDDQVLEQLDDFGDGQFFMHEVAKRLRAMAHRIAALKAERENTTALVGAVRRAIEKNPWTANLLGNALARLEFSAAPQPESEAETHLFVDRGDGRCKTCGHTLFATDFIHEVKSVAPPPEEKA